MATKKRIKIKDGCLQVNLLGLLIYGFAILHLIPEVVLSGTSPVEYGSEFAKQIASEEIAAMLGSCNSVGWTASSQVTDAFPVHLPGKPSPSYYECKIMTDGQPGGYVLVNVDQTDKLIPESTNEGTTNTEQFQQSLGRADIQVIRIVWFHYIATEQQSDEIIASTGFAPLQPQGLSKKSSGADFTVEENVLSEWSNLIASKGCHPLYTQEQLAQMYTEMDEEQLAKSLEYRWVTAELDEVFRCGWHTPQWEQIAHPTKSSAVGCGPTAWAIVYAYWRRSRQNRVGPTEV